ncbi:WD repeat-containing protein 44 [Linum perenne]
MNQTMKQAKAGDCGVVDFGRRIGEDERFYESLDCIGTSLCSSSTSDSDTDTELLPTMSWPSPNSEFPSSVHGSQFSISNYDIWVSEPTSVSERRNHLLQQMGLCSATSFFCPQEPQTDVNFRRSVCCGHFATQRLGLKTEGITGTNADGTPAASRQDCRGPNIDGDGFSNMCKDDMHYCSSSSSYSSLVLVCSPENFSGHSVNKNRWNCKRQDEQREASEKEKNAYVVGDIKLEEITCLQSSVASADQPSSDEPGRILDWNILLNTNMEEYMDKLNSYVTDNHAGGLADVCIIKNLDTGGQFVVDEIRKDGMWNKLKEVGTGRQLTMEEFEMIVGHSPIVQELMRRQFGDGGGRENLDFNRSGSDESLGLKLKQKTSWLRNMKSVASSIKGLMERSDERDTRPGRGARRSSSAVDDSLNVSHGSEKVRVKQYGKSYKQLTALYKMQEIRAHTGSIWTIKFSLDGRYLASAGEDCVIHVWKVLETERKNESLLEKPENGNFNLLVTVNGSPEPLFFSRSADGDNENFRRGRTSRAMKSFKFEHILAPENVFALTDKPICAFEGHLGGVLDLSWSKSQLLLSSSMDKTVRLWHISSKTCLKIFSHGDYVTCIQFNPVDDRFFLSGSLDAKVRIWSIPDRQVVDWNDIHEMVTAASYTPDGQGALVGSYKGSCQFYSTAENKLQQKCHINLQNNRKKCHLKKITGFQFVPGSSSEVLVTSSDSRIRVIDHIHLVHKFKGFRNTNSQISASVTSNAKFVVSASEGSCVYIWKHEATQLTRKKVVTVTKSYEQFHCQDVSAAIPWPGTDYTGFDSNLENIAVVNHPPAPVDELSSNECSQSLSCCNKCALDQIITNTAGGSIFHSQAPSSLQKKLDLAATTQSYRSKSDFANGLRNKHMPAYGMVIVTAGLRGEIRTYQNFGLPDRS